MKTSLGALAVAAALVLTGCGGGNSSVDTAAWKAALAKQGVTVSDWTKLRAGVDTMCHDTTEELGLMLTLQGAPSMDVMRTNFRYACPDRLDDLEQANADVGDATSNVQAACDTPKDQRTDEQEQLAEAMGC